MWENPPGQNPPGQNPADKTPQDKTPRDKTPQDKNLQDKTPQVLTDLKNETFGKCFVHFIFVHNSNYDIVALL